MVNKSSIKDVSAANFGNKINKRAQYKYGIILSLILGLMVLGLSLFFIFNEYFTGEDIDWEVCRQSIQLRAMLPDFEVTSFKDDYPLKCRTHVVEIGKDDVIADERGRIKKAEKKIAEAMAECWALYDKGDANAFPAEVFKSSTCVPCARIHLTEDAKSELGNRKIDIRGALDLPMDQSRTYYNFLSNSGDKFSAFDFGGGVLFDLEADKFAIEGVGWTWTNVDLQNKIGGTFEADVVREDISLPRFLEADKGDLMINYGIVTISGGEFGDYVPYLFYFQAGQQPSPFDEVKKTFIFNSIEAVSMVAKAFSILSIADTPAEKLEEVMESGVDFCESWEGIPA